MMFITFPGLLLVPQVNSQQVHANKALLGAVEFAILTLLSLP